MELALVRQRSSEHKERPNYKAIQDLKAVATTPEAAVYLSAAFDKAFASMLDKEAVRRVSEELHAHADYVILANSGNDVWAGKQPSTLFQNYQQGLASRAAKMVADKTITLDVAISDKSELLRGYSEGGLPLDEKSVLAMDKLFNSWLAENNMISKDGSIYQGTAEGQIKQDDRGNPVLVEPETLRDALGSQEDGFEQTVQKKNSSVEVIVQQQKYPEQKVAQEEVGPSVGAGSNQGV